MVRVASWFAITVVLVGFIAALWFLTLPIGRGALRGYTVRVLDSGRYLDFNWCAICPEERSYWAWQTTASGYTLFPDFGKPPRQLQRVELGECIRLSGAPTVRERRPLYFRRGGGDLCEVGDPPAAPPRRRFAPYTVTAAVGEPSFIVEEALSVEILSIKDGRCPVDATCIWAGSAEVTLQVRKLGMTARTIEIGTGAPRGMDVPFEATYGSYRFTLLVLEPRYSLSKPPAQSAYRAMVRVSKS